MDNFQGNGAPYDNIRYCKFCGQKVFADAVICVHCGRQIEENNNLNKKINGLHCYFFYLAGL